MVMQHGPLLVINPSATPGLRDRLLDLKGFRKPVETYQTSKITNFLSNYPEETINKLKKTLDLWEAGKLKTIDPEIQALLKSIPGKKGKALLTEIESKPKIAKPGQRINASKKIQRWYRAIKRTKTTNTSINKAGPTPLGATTHPKTTQKPTTTAVHQALPGATADPTISPLTKQTAPTQTTADPTATNDLLNQSLLSLAAKAGLDKLTKTQPPPPNNNRSGHQRNPTKHKQSQKHRIQIPRRTTKIHHPNPTSHTRKPNHSLHSPDGLRKNRNSNSSSSNLPRQNNLRLTASPNRPNSHQVQTSPTQQKHPSNQRTRQPKTPRRRLRTSRKNKTNRHNNHNNRHASLPKSKNPIPNRSPKTKQRTTKTRQTKRRNPNQPSKSRHPTSTTNHSSLQRTNQNPTIHRRRSPQSIRK